MVQSGLQATDIYLLEHPNTFRPACTTGHHVVDLIAVVSPAIDFGGAFDREIDDGSSLVLGGTNGRAFGFIFIFWNGCAFGLSRKFGGTSVEAFVFGLVESSEAIRLWFGR